MRVGLVSDVHGNLLALEAVLFHLDKDSVDRIICLGDIAATGPKPHEVAERISRTIPECVMGNHDEVLNMAFPRSPEEDKNVLWEIDAWCARQLSQSDSDFLRSFKPVLKLPLVDGKTLVAFHGSPRSNKEWLFSNTPEQELKEALSGHKADVMACGHTHMQMLRQIGSTVLVNPGSVGLPYETDPFTGASYVPSRADYAVINCRDSALDIEFKRIPIDSENRRRSILESSMPHKQVFLQTWPRQTSRLYEKFNHG